MRDHQAHGGRIRSPFAVYVVCFIAKRRLFWRWGHSALDEVRRLTLRYEDSKSKDEVYGGLLYLAENVAKVTYNATNPPDPFDDDVDAWVAVSYTHLTLPTTPYV